MGPWWTGYHSKWYALIVVVQMDLMAWDAREYFCRPHSTAGEPAMADGEATTVANAGTALWTSPIETKPTRMIYRCS